MQQATANHVYKIQAIRYENVSLQGKIGAKDQEIATLQRRHVGYFANEDKNHGMTITAQRNEAAYYFESSMTIEGTISKSCRHRIKVALCLQKEIHQMQLLCRTYGKKRIIAIDLNKGKNFRLDPIKREQFLALNNM